MRVHGRRVGGFWKEPGFLLLGLALVALVLSGCDGIYAAARAADGGLVRVNGSGSVITKDLEFKDFDQVEVGSTFNLELVRADTYSVAVTADDNLFEHIDIHQQGRTLHIGLKRATFGNGTWRARVTMPSLERLEVSGASRATLAGFASEGRMEFDVSGASTLTGRLDADTVDLEASGASTVELGGTTASLELEVSGASRAELGDLPVTDARARVSGAGKATINISGTLDADASGASTIAYVGNPTLGRTTTSGASSIRRR